MAMAFLRAPAGPMTVHFWGPVANWGLVGSAAYDAYFKGPDIISLNMSGTMILYSGLFMRYAWCITPRNYLLLACHTFNVAAQGNQLRRGLEYKLENEGTGAMAEINTMAAGAAATLGAIGASLVVRKRVQTAMANTSGMMKSIAEAPAGPFYIHFWAPTSKWLLSVSNIMDLKRPVEKISLAQMSCLTVTGIVWTRFAMVIIPKNYNLALVNVVLATSSGWHLARKLNAEYGPK
jgi:hypothetical protein